MQFLINQIKQTLVKEDDNETELILVAHYSPMSFSWSNHDEAFAVSEVVYIIAFQQLHQRTSFFTGLGAVVTIAAIFQTRRRG